jgi:hypothetical protein
MSQAGQAFAEQHYDQAALAHEYRKILDQTGEDRRGPEHSWG